MATKGSQSENELEELRQRLDWMDEERRRNNRRLAEFEQRMTSWQRKLEDREVRIKELEEKLGSAMSQLGRLSHIDNQLQLFKEEIVQLLDQYDQRRITGQQEIEKLRLVEQEVRQRETADIRKEIKILGQLQSDIEAGKAEQSRLAKLIGGIQPKLTALNSALEQLQQESKFNQEAQRADNQAIVEIRTSIFESSKRLEALEMRLDVTSHNTTKMQTSLQELANEQSDLRENMKAWSDRVQVAEFKRDKRLEDWQRILEEHQEAMVRYSREWVKYADLYKEAKMTVEALPSWQEGVEQKQREVSEANRLEANQMRARWAGFVQENDKRLKNFEVDQEQRWSSMQRRESQISVQLHELLEKIELIERDKETLWRVQTAQADAMKKWPRIWLEEVEKAITHNPNSRRQPALVPVREE